MAVEDGGAALAGVPVLGEPARAGGVVRRVWLLVLVLAVVVGTEVACRPGSRGTRVGRCVAGVVCERGCPQRGAGHVRFYQADDLFSLGAADAMAAECRGRGVRMRGWVCPNGFETVLAFVGFA